MRDLNERRHLAEYGIHMVDTAIYAEDAWRHDLIDAVRVNRALAAPAVNAWAMDAQPALVTTVNAGIPAFLANILDPQVVNVILAPLLAAEVVGGETKKGDWTTQSLMMPMAEPTGTVVTYGDYDNGGMVDANIDWVSRQPWNYQTIKTVGEKELAQWGLAAIDMNGQKDAAVARTFAQIQNFTYFYGVSGLQNYGLLNDPSLPAAITPVTKTGGGTTWPNGTAEEIYKDFIKLFNQLNSQMGGNVQMTDEIVVALSTTRMAYLQTISALTLIAVSVAIKAAFPNLRFVTAPQYNTGSGELMQMWIPNYQGIQSAWCGFTEKMRGHPIVQQLSAWAQKFSGGTWGAVIRRPVCCAQMIGI